MRKCTLDASHSTWPMSTQERNHLRFPRNVQLSLISGDRVKVEVIFVFVQQIFIECLLHTMQCSWCWEDKEWY